MVAFIHSGYFYSASSSPLVLRGSPGTARIVTVSEFHVEATQETASEGLAQGPYVTARAGVEATTIRPIGVDSTNEPQRFFTCSNFADQIERIIQYFSSKTKKIHHIIIITNQTKK